MKIEILVGALLLTCSCRSIHQRSSADQHQGAITVESDLDRQWREAGITGFKARISLRSPVFGLAVRIRGVVQIQVPNRFRIIWLDHFLSPVVDLICDGESAMLVDRLTMQGYHAVIPDQGLTLPGIPVAITSAELVTLLSNTLPSAQLAFETNRERNLSTYALPDSSPGTLTNIVIDRRTKVIVERLYRHSLNLKQWQARYPELTTKSTVTVPAKIELRSDTEVVTVTLADHVLLRDQEPITTAFFSSIPVTEGPWSGLQKLLESVVQQNAHGLEGK